MKSNMKSKNYNYKKGKRKNRYSAVIIFPILFFLFILNSCHKEVKAKKGGIDLVSNVYFGASKGLDKMQNFHLSRLNYSGDTIIELVPDPNIPQITNEVFFIKDSLCFKIDSKPVNKVILSELYKHQKPFLVQKKKEGALFSEDKIPNYRNRKNLRDTILFKKKYKRFEVNSPWNYSRFYIYETDTILPYSLYRHAEKDYHGRVERIDSYNKKKDVFVTLQLLPRKNWDNEAKEIFDYNTFVKEKK